VQRAIVEATRRAAPRRITYATVEWAAGRDADRAIHADPTGRVRAAWATGRRQRALLGIDAYESVVVALLGLGHGLPHSYHDASRVLRLACLRRRGLDAREQAEDIAPGCGLTRAEAAEWLREAPLGPVLPVGMPAHAHDAGSPVAAWLLGQWRRDEWAGVRRGRQGGALSDRLDEVRPEDVAGTTSPREVCLRIDARRRREDAERADWARRAPERAAEAARLQAEQDAKPCPVPAWWRPWVGARLPVNGAEIRAWGDAENHCVAKSIPDVLEGSLVVVLIEADDGTRSTLGIFSDHRAPTNLAARNQPASPACERIADVVIRAAGRRP
jgi:hypothetical protein